MNTPRQIITDQIKRHVAMTEDHRAWLADDIATRIEAILAPLEQDKARIDWLQDAAARLAFEAEDDGSLPSAYVYIPSDIAEGGWALVGEGDDYREAIDTARGRELTADTEAQRKEDRG